MPIKTFLRQYLQTKNMQHLIFHNRDDLIRLGRGGRKNQCLPKNKTESRVLKGSKNRLIYSKEIKNRKIQNTV